MKYVNQMQNAMYVQVRDEQGNVLDYSVTTIDKAKARELFNDMCNTLLDDSINGTGYRVYAILNDECTEFAFLFSITTKVDYVNNEISLSFKGV